MADVVVCGAGPGGAVTAALLAESGHRVVVVDGEVFPRFHIGESLLPLSNPIFERLGLDPKSLGVQSVQKHGVTFLSECNQRRARIEFKGAPGIKQPETMQVMRAGFDQLLLDRAQAKGARLIAPCQALGVDFDRPLPRVQLKDSVGREFAIDCRFVVDATGRKGVLARQLGLRRMDRGLRKAALFGHFKGIPFQDGRAAGDIRIILRPGQGWVWLIPLPGGVTSVGFVFDSGEKPKDLAESPSACLERWMGQLPLLQPFMEKLEVTNQPSWESDFSYSTRAYSGSNWLLVGDAGSFIDPVFSSGVLLALSGAVDAAGALDRALGANLGRGRGLLRAYGSEQQRRYRFYRRLVLKFYSPGFQEILFATESWPAGTRALVSALGGNDRPDMGTRLRLEALYLIAWLKNRSLSNR